MDDYFANMIANYLYHTQLQLRYTQKRLESTNRELMSIKKIMLHWVILFWALVGLGIVSTLVFFIVLLFSS